MTYEKTQDLNPKQFKRLVGVSRNLFAEMTEYLRKQAKKKKTEDQLLDSLQKTCSS